jgi:ubiquinone/menaquinone biosynthesis C-methylase UbiE
MTTDRDQDAAEGFAVCIVPRMMAPWVDHLLQAVAPKPGDRILDLACGTGAVTGRLPASSGIAVGMDRNPLMIDLARRGLQDSAEIHWMLGDAVALPCAGASLDIVVCQQGLQFFSPPSAALQEIQRVLAPGGRVGFVVWSRIENNPYCLAVARAVGRHMGEECGDLLRSSFSLGEGKELRTLLRAAGFDEVHVRAVRQNLSLGTLAEFVPAHIGGTSLANRFASQGAGIQAAVVADVVKQAQPLPEGEDVAFPFEIQLAVGRRAAG